MGRGTVWAGALLVSMCATQVPAAERTAQWLYEAGCKHKLAARYDFAEAALAAAVRDCPDHVDARWTLGWVLAEQGKKAEAAEQFRIILRRQPGTVRALESAAALERMGESPYYPRPDLASVAPSAMEIRAHKRIDRAANPLWTGDGNQLVYTRMGVGICVADADGANPRLVGPGLKLIGVAAESQKAYGVALTAAPGTPPAIQSVDLVSSAVTTLDAALTVAPETLVAAPGDKAMLTVASVPDVDPEKVPTNVLALVSADGATATELAPCKLSLNPVWSADGSKLLYGADGKVMVAEGTAARAVAEGNYAAWLGNDKLLVRAPAGNLVVVGADGSGAEPLVSAQWDPNVCAAWASPTGKWVLYKENERSFSAVNVATKQVVPLGSPDRPVIAANWLPNADLLVLCDRRPDLGHEPVWEVYDPANPLYYHPLLRDTFVYGKIDVSPDGRLAAYWQGSPDSICTDEESSYRQKCSGRLIVGATDNTARLPWTIVTEKTTGSTAGTVWSPKSDAVAYSLPSKEAIGVISLGPYTGPTEPSPNWVSATAEAPATQ